MSEIDRRGGHGGVTGVLIRSPFTLLGAVGLVNLVSSVITFQHDIQQLIAAFQAVTRPVWDFLLGWAFHWFEMEIPLWLKDYLTAGVILGGCYTRAIWTLQRRFKIRNYLQLISTVLFWPLATVLALGHRLAEGLSEYADMDAIFAEAFLYAAIIIVASYVLMAG